MPPSPQDRRQVLSRIRCGDAVLTGPLSEGLRESDGIAVASFFSPYVCRRFRRALAAAGVSSTTRKDGIKTSVEVHYGDREAAWQVVAEQQSEYPDRRPSGTRGAYDFTILGAVAGTLMGIASLTLSPHTVVRVVAWAGFIGSGIVAGCVADRFQRSYRYLGHFRFDLFDGLLLMTAAAIILSFWTYLSWLL